MNNFEIPERITIGTGHNTVTLSRSELVEALGRYIYESSDPGTINHNAISLLTHEAIIWSNLIGEHEHP